MAVPLTVFYRVKRKRNLGSENLDLSEFFDADEYRSPIPPSPRWCEVPDDDKTEPRAAIRTEIYSIRSW